MFLLDDMVIVYQREMVMSGKGLTYLKCGEVIVNLDLDW